MKLGPECICLVDGMKTGIVYVRVESNADGEGIITGVWNKVDKIFNPGTDVDPVNHVYPVKKAVEASTHWLWRANFWNPDLEPMQKLGTVAMFVRLNADGMPTEVMDTLGRQQMIIMAGASPC